MFLSSILARASETGVVDDVGGDGEVEGDREREVDLA